ncbi:MAG: SRPBCC family protein [Acidobacteriota bacterium]
MTDIVMGRKDGFFTLHSTLVLPRSRAEVFPFFADARNLETITPPWLKFRILSKLPVGMAEGARIIYRLQLHGIPLRWESEITLWQPPFRFIDEQRRGPYRAWIHEHSFEESDRGCRMTDYVRYKVLGGVMVHSVFVKKDVLQIFNYRTEILQKLFPPKP